MTAMPDLYLHPGIESFEYPVLNSNVQYIGALPTPAKRCDPEAPSQPPTVPLQPRRAVVVNVSGRLDWAAGPLPAGTAQLGALFTFGLSPGYDAASGYAAYAAVPADVVNGAPTSTPGAAMDSAMSTPQVQDFLRQHADDTQLTATPRLTAADWAVEFSSIDVGTGAKHVAPSLTVHVDRRTNRVTSVT